MTYSILKENIHNFYRHAYTSYGGYPMAAITRDGSCLCQKCVRENYRDIALNTKELIHNARPYDPGWGIEFIDVNWEDHDLQCDHCGTDIEAAY